MIRIGVALAISCCVMGSTLPAESPEKISLRVATYNASLYGKVAGQVRRRLVDGKDLRAEKMATIVQTVRPDILLVNEIDFEKDGMTAKLFAEKFLGVGQGSLSPMQYPNFFVAPSNTGIDSKLDLNGNGKIGEPNDAWGYGVYPGQYSFAVFSRFPIDKQGIRTFRKFRWKDLPDSRQPCDPETKQKYYDEATWDVLRLSSKNHVDVPIQVGDRVVHLLASHPTPPVFDGPEDRNGCRNHDEIRFWKEYISAADAGFLVDDQGRRGGLADDELFIIAGDLNSDPADGDSQSEAIKNLLEDPRVIDSKPSSEGAVTAYRGSGDRGGDAKLDTASFGRGGNMRIDYVLPSRPMTLRNAHVFWPPKDDPNHALISASDHRMVWIEVELPQ